MSIADDRIEDKDIGPLWAEHYPKRYDRLSSKAVCLMLFYIITDRAQVLFPGGELSDQLCRACELFDVPREQFYEIGKDADEE
jgi:hypothetical protein